MNSVPYQETLILAAILFGLGLIGVLARRNLVFILLSIEIMLNATALAFIGAGARWQAPDGQVLFLFILSTAAAEVAVGLALVLRINHQFRTLDADSVISMRG